MTLTWYVRGNSLYQTYKLHMISNVGHLDKTKHPSLTKYPFYRYFSNDKKILPKEFIEDFNQTCEKTIGPFAGKMHTDKLVDLGKVKFCPECIKEQVDPYYHSLFCFDTCLEHNAPLISTCPHCGQSLVRNENYFYIIECKICGKRIGEVSPVEAVFYSHKNKDRYPPEDTFKQNSHDLNAWIIDTDDDPPQEAKAPAEEISSFLRNYFLTGERGEPSLSLLKKDYKVQKADFIEFRDNRIDQHLETLTARHKDASSINAIKLMKQIPSTAHRKYPNNCFFNINYIQKKVYSLPLHRAIANEIVNELEDMFQEEYLKLTRPVTDLFPNQHKSCLMLLFPELILRAVIFETGEGVDVYAFFEGSNEIRPFYAPNYESCTSPVKKYIKACKGEEYFKGYKDWQDEIKLFDFYVE